ncbi:MAG: hypothetical protein PHN74_02000 [Candidatus Pacebacteria bacterium]|nr:hypothetical protein [Candidatus Paceibacterota bacterium]
MKYIKLILVICAVGFSGLAFLPAKSEIVDTRSEIHVTKDGKVTVENAKITHLIGTTYFAKPVWGGVSIRLIIKTNENTKIINAYGEKLSLADLKVDDYLRVEGELESSETNFMVIAKEIKNLSIRKKTITFSGRVGGFATSTGNTFFLTTPKDGTVAVNASFAEEFKKGSLSITTSRLNIGDKVTSVSGTMDYPTNTLMAQKIKVYADMNVFKPKNFQGILKEISGNSLPLTMVLEISGKTYTVKVPETAKILNNKRGAAQLGRFVVGDTVRVYGAIQEIDPSVIDGVTVVRNTSI